LQRKQLPIWHWSNEILQGWAGSLLLLVIVIAIAAGGWWVGLWFIAQALHGISLLEVVNYVEHYGLKRQKLENGRYEKCAPKHSWNSNTVYSNITLFQLQRHSDHHANPTRPYQILRHFDDAPQLPSGYSAMISLAYIPPLWFRHMDKRVLAHYNGDRSLANEYTKEPNSQLPSKENILAATQRGIEQLRQQLRLIFH
jgi:alkane 1-monooxygenase